MVPDLETESRSELERTFRDTLTFRDEFSLGRVTEGYGVAQYIKSRFRGLVTIIDVGSGNGGVRIALASVRQFRVLSVDRSMNADLVAVRRKIPVPFWHVVADANALPIRGGSADFVTLLETLEHLRHPAGAGSEIMRVLKPFGMCMVATPARMRYLFGRDPHYGVRGLLLLPDRVQAWIARILKIEDYDVTHTYWHVREVARLFPGEKEVEILWDNLPPFRDYPRKRIWWAFRNFLWNRLVFKKRGD